MDIIAEIVSALTKQEHVVLATIISSSGSTPLPAGATMLLKQHGDIALGTVGGGLLEANVTNEARQLFAQDSRSVIHRFELNESSSEEGMICGGDVEVLIEPIGGEELLLFSKLLDLHNEGNNCTLLRVIDSSQTLTKRTVLECTSNEVALQPPLDSLLRDLKIPSDMFVQSLQQAHRQETVKIVVGSTARILIQPIIGLQSLIIFGGGHIGRSLSKIATIAGFTVTIIDDREEYANARRFPEASQTLAVKFQEAFQHIDIRPSTSIVIATRRHQTDGEVLERAVKTPARYIGMIGSSKKVASTYAQLQKDGVPVLLLKRVHAPIGLDIGAVTAEEIAVSIVAELIQVRRGIPAASASMWRRMNQWFDEVEARFSEKRQGK